MAGEDFAADQAVADAAFGDARASAQEAIAGTVPPAAEPLSPSSIETVQAAVASAVEALGGGQIPTPEPVSIDAPQESIPPVVFEQVAAVGEFLTSFAGFIPEAASHAFSAPEFVTTNSDLLELAGILDGIANDKKLHQAVQQPVAPPEPEGDLDAPPAAEPERDLDGLVGGA